MSAHRNTSLTPLEQSLAEQAEALEREIAQDVRQQQLTIMKKAMAEMAALRGGPAVMRPQPKVTNRVASSVHQAAQFALEDVGHPLPLAELFPLLAAYGRTPGGSRPTWNLSNTLSVNKDAFQSVIYRGEKCWWLTGKPIPKE